jgi:hypothetical protein
MAKGDSNPSLSLDTLFPTLSDESFLQFLKDYYRFLQSTKLTLTGVSGTFVKGEVITGADSKATGVVFSVGTNEIIVVMSTEKPLDSTEIITGSTSGATATVANVKDNVIRESARLKDSRSQYVSGDEFFQLLKDELNRGYPSTSESDRRLLYNRIRDLLQSKSTEEAYRFLFKAFFDENIEIRFPGDDILRVSDGKFEKTSLIRVIPTNTNAFPVGEIFDFLNKTIRGQTSGAVGTVVNISISFLGGVQFAEFNLKLVSGEFEAGETVADVLQPRLSTEVFGVIGDIRIIDGGSGYSVGDQLTITGDGAEATAEVSSISTGPINRIIVNTPGYGYRLNTRASIDNTDTAGNNLAIIVSSIANTYTVTDGSNTFVVGDTTNIQISNRGSGYQRTPDITLVDTTIQALGLLSERLITITDSGNNYAVGETLTFTGGAGTNAAGEVASVGNTAPYGEDNLLFEDDFVLLQEQEVNGLKSAIKSEDWTNIGPILRIELTNLGSGYTSANLPVLTLESANTVSGANASFTVNNIQGVSANVTVDIANNSVGIGSIRQIDIRNPGINFSSANVSATTVGDGNANLEAIISGLNVNRGFFTNDDGKVNFKIIQDSFFYQDFSYVIRSGLIIDAYKELVKETVHPAGLEFFGEIVITSIIGLQAEFRSQIDQTPRPLALSSFLSLYPVGVNLPYSGSIREVEITPEVIDQVLVGPRTSKFDDKNLSIREIAFERGISVPADFTREITNKIYLFIDVALFPTFSDIQTGTIPTIPVELDYILSGISNIVDTHREYQIEIAPIRMEQPLAVRDFNVREIEIVKNIDVAVDIDRVKTFDFIGTTYGDIFVQRLQNDLISSFSTITFLDESGLEQQIFRERADRQGLEIDIELVSTDLQAEVVPSTSFGTESEVPLFVSVPLIRSFVDEIVNRLELYIDVSPEIVYNDVQILETAISDVTIQIFSIAQDTLRYGDILISQLASEQISEYASTSFRDTFIVPLSPARTYQRVEVDIELPLVTVIASVQPFRIAVDRLRLPTLGLGISVIDATINFEGTSYEIDVRPDNIFSTLRVIPQNTGRVKTLRYFVPPLTATIPNIYEVIKIQPELDLAPIPRMKLEIDVPPGFTAPFKEQIKDIQIATLASEIIGNVDPVEDYSNKTFLDTAYRYQSMSKTDIDYRIEIYQFIDSRMRFYSEILTMTNREMTVELEVFSGPVDVSTRHGRTVTVNYFSFGDVPLTDFADQTISAYSSTAFNDPPGISFTREVPSTFYEIDIEPVRSQVVSLFIPTVEHLGNTERQISLYADLRMAFYSEIYTMTNRVHTTEIEIQTEVSIAAIAPQETAINYVIAPAVIDVSLAGVTDFNIREIEITPATMDLRMAFYAEIYTMTNRVHTTEIEIQSGTNVIASFRKTFELDIAPNPRTVIGEEDVQVYEDELIRSFASSTFNDSVNRNAVSLNTTIEVINFIELDALDSRMRFYTEVLTMTNREMTVEIDVIGEKVDVSTTHSKLESISYYQYADVPIVNYASETIASYAANTLNESPGVSFTREIPLSSYDIEIHSFEDASPDFNANITPFGDELLATFASEQIQTIATLTFENEYSNLNISKNVFIDGTVTFTDPSFAGLAIRRLSLEQIDSYSTDIFTNASGSNTSVIGTNTSFTTAFTVGGTLITLTEKFLISSIANNEYLEVNVNPEENYNDASVYREYFV